MIASVFCYIKFASRWCVCMRLNNNRMLKLKCERSMCAQYILFYFIVSRFLVGVCVWQTCEREIWVNQQITIKHDGPSRVSVSGASVWPAVLHVLWTMYEWIALPCSFKFPPQPAEKPINMSTMLYLLFITVSQSVSYSRRKASYRNS